jgi:hypothetical protein
MAGLPPLQVVHEVHMGGADEEAVQEAQLNRIAEKDGKFASNPSVTSAVPSKAASGHVRHVRFLDSEVAYWHLATQHVIVEGVSSNPPKANHIRALEGLRCAPPWGAPPRRCCRRLLLQVAAGGGRPEPAVPAAGRQLHLGRGAGPLKLGASRPAAAAAPAAASALAPPAPRQQPLTPSPSHPLTPPPPGCWWWCATTRWCSRTS